MTIMKLLFTAKVLAKLQIALRFDFAYGKSETIMNYEIKIHVSLVELRYIKSMSVIILG